MQQTRVGAQAQTPTTKTGDGAARGAWGAVIQMMRGQDLAAQLETLAPRENARPGAGGDATVDGAPVQMKVDMSMLEAKLSSTPEYSGTIDSATDCATANEVGAAWVGGGAARIKYGPPFGYQLVNTANGRAYRPPMVKQSGQARGNAQANYQAARGGSGTNYTFNAHVTVTDIDAHMPPPSDSSSSSTGVPSGGASSSTGAPGGGSTSSTGGGGT